MTLPSFAELDRLSRKSEGRLPYTGSLLSFDPGETTGYAFFKDHELVEVGQLVTSDIPIGAKLIMALMEDLNPDKIVIEDYRIYGWKQEQHAWSSLHTPRLIGSIETLCALREIEPTKQMAGLAKQFATDDKLREWNFWIKGKKHARDAIRHAIYYILFHDKSKKKKSKAGQHVG